MNSEYFRALFDAVTESIFLTDLGGTVLVANRVFMRRLGKTGGKPEHLTLFDCMSETAAEARKKHLEHVIRTKRPVRFTDEQAGRILDNTMVPVFDRSGDVERLAVFGHDITEEHRKQARLDTNLVELKRSNRDLERFASIASHDLQEPLRSITMFIERIEARYAPLLDETGREYLRRVAGGAARMEQLIHGLLQYSRVSSKGGEFCGCPLDEVLTETLDTLQITIMKTGAEIRREPLPRLLADPLQIGQLFQNLLVNALKYAREGVRPVVSIRAEKIGRWWEVSVADNGIGIAPEHYETVFEIFRRLHDQSRYQGTGIGLAVCKRIVERHGGTIRVSSVPGEGSIFTFTLPDTGECGSTGIEAGLEPVTEKEIR